MPISFTGGAKFDPMPPIFHYERVIIQLGGEVSSKPEPHGPDIDLDKYIHIKLNKYYTVLLPKDYSESELFEVWTWAQNYLNQIIAYDIMAVEEEGDPEHPRTNIAKDRLNLTMSIQNLTDILEI